MLRFPTRTNYASYGPAVALLVSVQPVGALSGSSLSVQPVLHAIDSDGNIDQNYTTDVEAFFAIGVGEISGGTVAFVAGIATYTALAITGPNKDKLRFRSGSLPFVESEFFYTAFDLTSISGLRVFDARSLSLSNGDPVSTWTDDSASAITATASGSVRPTYAASVAALGGQPAVAFDGVNDGLLLSESLGWTDFSIIAVMAAADDNAAGARVFDCYDGSEGAVLLRDASDSTKWGGSANEASVANGAFSPVAVNEGRAVTLRRGYTSNGITVSWGSGWSDSIGYNGNSSAFSANVAHIGCDKDGTNNFKGKIAALFYLNRKFTLAEQDLLYGEIQRVWGMECYALTGNARYMIPTNRWLSPDTSLRMFMSTDGGLHGGELLSDQFADNDYAPGVGYVPSAGGMFVSNAHYLEQEEYCIISSDIYKDTNDNAPTFTVTRMDWQLGCTEVAQVNMNRGDAAGLVSIFRAQGMVDIYNASGYRDWRAFYVTFDANFGSPTPDLFHFKQYVTYPTDATLATWTDPVEITVTNRTGYSLQDFVNRPIGGQYIATYVNWGTTGGSLVYADEVAVASNPAGPWVALNTVGDNYRNIGFEHEGSNIAFLTGSGQVIQNTDKYNIPGTGGIWQVRQLTGDMFTDPDNTTWTTAEQAGLSESGALVGGSLPIHQSSILDRVRGVN